MMTGQQLEDHIPCACVSYDAVTCARKRDGLDTDDPDWDHRKCECACHLLEEDDDGY